MSEFGARSELPISISPNSPILMPTGNRGTTPGLSATGAMQSQTTFGKILGAIR